LLIDVLITRDSAWRTPNNGSGSEFVSAMGEVEEGLQRIAGQTVPIVVTVDLVAFEQNAFLLDGVVAGERVKVGGRWSNRDYHGDKQYKVIVNAVERAVEVTGPTAVSSAAD
jgi:hypothetical protein